MNIDDNTYSVEIGIDAEEEELGVIGGRCIRWKHLTVYVYECADGLVVTGMWVTSRHAKPDPDLGRARAQRKALDRLTAQRKEARPVPKPPNRAASPAQADGALTP